MANTEGRTAKSWAEVLSPYILLILICSISLIIYLAATGKAVSVGSLGEFSIREASKQESNSVWVTEEPFRMDKNSVLTIDHSLGVTPALVQVWSSASRTGPWDLVHPGFYKPDDRSLHYGIYVTDASEEQISLQSGNTSASSTYGAGKHHWDRYHRGRSVYDVNNVWFRVTAIGVN